MIGTVTPNAVGGTECIINGGTFSPTIFGVNISVVRLRGSLAKFNPSLVGSAVSKGLAGSAVTKGLARSAVTKGLAGSAVTKGLVGSACRIPIPKAIFITAPLFKSENGIL